MSSFNAERSSGMGDIASPVEQHCKPVIGRLSLSLPALSGSGRATLIGGVTSPEQKALNRKVREGIAKFAKEALQHFPRLFVVPLDSTPKNLAID